MNSDKKLLNHFKKLIILNLAFLAIFTQLARGEVVEPLKLKSERVIGGGNYIIPNEHQFWRFKKVLKEKENVLISVGTFRTLFNATLGNFSRVIMLDINATVSSFNRTNLQLIRGLKESGLSSLKQRLYYIWLLQNENDKKEWNALNSAEIAAVRNVIPIELEQKFLELISLGRKSAMHLSTFDADLVLPGFNGLQFIGSRGGNTDFLKFDRSTLAIRVSQDLVKAIYWNTSTGKIEKYNLPPDLGSRVLGLFTSPTSPPRTARMKDYALLLEITSLAGIGTRAHQETYWSSDQTWEKIQTLILENRISVVNGDLGGKITVKSIAEELSRVGEKVSAVDLSNVPQFIHTTLSPSGSNKMPFILANLELLPLTDDAEILMTAGKMQNLKHKEYKDSEWTYFAMSWSTFLEDSKSFLIGSNKYFFHLYSRFNLQTGKRSPILISPRLIEY